MKNGSWNDRYRLSRIYIYVSGYLLVFFSYLIAFLLNLSLMTFSYLRVICGKLFIVIKFRFNGKKFAFPLIF